MSFSKIVHMWLVQGCFKHHPWGRQHSILVCIFIYHIYSCPKNCKTKRKTCNI